MKEIFRKIASFLMAFVVLFSTFSFTINEHYCGDELKDRSFVFKADKCEMEMQMIHSDAECNFHKKKCCEDVISVVEGQDELKVDFNKLTFDQQLFIASFIDAYLNLFEGLKENIIPFKEYSPPFLVTDIQVVNEIYLI